MWSMPVLHPHVTVVPPLPLPMLRRETGGRGASGFKEEGVSEEA